MPVVVDPPRPVPPAPSHKRQHQDKPFDYGPPDLRPDLLQFYSFRFYAILADGGEALLTNVEEATWDDGAANHGAIMIGTLTLRNPSYGLWARARVDEGDQIRCEYDDGAGAWTELWTMRVQSPKLQVHEGQRTYNLANDLDLLQRSVDDFVFPVGNAPAAAGVFKAQPDGWTFDEVVKAVCAKYHVVVRCAAGVYKRRKTWAWRNISPLEVFQKAMNVERVHTGKRFSIRWEKGGLTISPLRRNPHLLALGSSLIEAAYSTHLAQGQSTNGVNEGYFATALTVRGSLNTAAGLDAMGHDKNVTQKLRVEVQAPATTDLIKRYGYVHRVVWSADAATLADLRAEGIEYLAAVAKPIRELTLTHVGIPTIRRGDAIRLGLGDRALFKQTVWVTEAAFSLQPADFAMTLTVTFEDPYIDKVGKRIIDLLSENEAAAVKLQRKPRVRPALAPVRSDQPAPGTMKGAQG